jgi:hypothetical protein
MWPYTFARMSRNWAKMLLAILLGNLLYLATRPYLPAIFAHKVFRVDAGLLLDMALCAGLYLTIRKIF